MTIRKLTNQEREELSLRHKIAKENSVRDRIRSVLKYDQNYTFEEIAGWLLISKETVRGYVLDYHNNNKLQNEHKGKQSFLKDTQEQELIDHLNNNLYTSALDVAAYIFNKYHVQYSKQGTIDLLHRLGFSYKEPKIIPALIDVAKQEVFKEKYKEIKENLPKDQVIYFIDGVHPQSKTRSSRGWIKTSEVKTLPSFGGWKRKSILGAINLDTLDVIYQDNKTINEDVIIEFLNKIMSANEHKSKIYVILDNAGYNKSLKVQNFVKDSKIELFFLPPYSPNLNPIERLWKFMYKKIINNRFYTNFREFSDRVDKFFKNLHIHKNSLKLLINDNFEAIKVNHLSLA